MIIYYLSLYSTRTQNTWRRGLALGNAPDARILRYQTRYPTQNIPMLVYFALGNAHFSRFTRRVLPDAFYPTRFTRRVLPDAFYPTRFIRRQSVEYRWRWAFWRWGWRWPCTFHILCVDFICVWYPTRTQFPVEYWL